MKGEPAFPIVGSIEGPDREGITIRDYFAAQAMEALILSRQEDPQCIAVLAYRYADAMLDRREFPRGAE